MKRTLHGTYIAVRPFHLNAYLDEQVFRFNGRDGNDADRFVAALKGTDGKRVTYAALTTSHPRWRLRPGRAARAQARRAMIAQEPISGKSDHLVLILGDCWPRRGRRSDGLVNDFLDAFFAFFKPSFVLENTLRAKSSNRSIAVSCSC